MGLVFAVLRPHALLFDALEDIVVLQEQLGDADERASSPYTVISDENGLVNVLCNV